MARITDDEAARLVQALARTAAEPPQREDLDAHDDAVAVQCIERAARDASRADALGRALTLDLASYLNRPVRCSVAMPAPPVASAWRFEGVGSGGDLWLDLDVGLASAIAIAMIGGAGPASVGHGKRVRGLVELAALRMLRGIAEASGVRPPDAARFEAVPDASAQAVAGGLCAIEAEQHPWAYGVAKPRTHERSIPPPVELAAPSDDDIDKPAGLLDAVFIAPAAAPRHVLETPDAALRRAIKEAVANIQDTLRLQIEADAPEVTSVVGAADAEMPDAVLRLALTAGGSGALVATLDRGAVAGIAGGVAGITMPPDGISGIVAIAAAEAVVRDLLDALARGLAGTSGIPHRIVRLAEVPLPAHAPHHAAHLRIVAGGRSGWIRFLVPSWMLTGGGPGGQQSDAVTAS